MEDRVRWSSQGTWADCIQGVMVANDVELRERRGCLCLLCLLCLLYSLFLAGFWQHVSIEDGILMKVRRASDCLHRDSDNGGRIWAPR